MDSSGPVRCHIMKCHFCVFFMCVYVCVMVCGGVMARLLRESSRGQTNKHNMYAKARFLPMWYSEVPSSGSRTSYPHWSGRCAWIQFREAAQPTRAGRVRKLARSCRSRFRMAWHQLSTAKLSSQLLVWKVRLVDLMAPLILKRSVSSVQSSLSLVQFDVSIVCFHYLFPFLFKVIFNKLN